MEGDQSESLAVARRIDALCDEFELALATGTLPPIESFLTDVLASERQALLLELLGLELDFRVARGELPQVGDYANRFPELSAEQLDARFSEISDPQRNKPPQSANQSTVSLAQETVIQQPADTLQVEVTEIPKTFGRYRIVKALGQGAMGAVYLAHDQQLDRQVALKIPKFAEADSQELLARFHREARLAAALRHPNICPVFDVGEFDGRHYITMAFIEGRSLSEFVSSKRAQPLRQVAIVIRKLAVALEEAHARGVIHRDLKPANIMIDAKGEPIVMDFGLARRASHEESQVTHSGAILGTPAYMSPEQVEGDQTQIGPVADVYSLGVIFYELLTRQRPFQGSVMSVLRQIGIGNPQPPSRLRADVDPVLEGICLKMMSRQQGDRYSSMNAVAQTLTEYLKSTPGQASPTTSLSTGVTATTSEALPDEASAATFLLPSATNSVSVLPDAEDLEATQRASAISTKSADRRRFSRIWLSVAAAAVAGIVLLLGATFFIRVGNVDVKVVIDDPRLVVKFDKETVTFEGSGSPIRLKPGDHKFIVERDGLEVETDHFTVKKNGKHVLEVSVVDGKVVVRKDDQKPKTTSLANKPDSSSSPNAGWHGWPADAPAPAIAPFDAEQAKTHQEAWAKHLGVPVEFTNSIGMKFRLIPPGEFTMGSTPEEIEAALQLIHPDDKHWPRCTRSESPQHTVILTKPIYLGVHEVTQSQYEQVMGKNPSHFAPSGAGSSIVAGIDTANHPVEKVSWNDAAEFCSKLSQQTKLKPFYYRVDETITPLDGTGYRLPTEAEWEFACRAGTTSKFWNGDHEANLLGAAWSHPNAGGRTHAVGELQSNPFGIHDVCGNLFEWVQDEWEPNYYSEFREKPAVNPSGPSPAGARHVTRGGAWTFIAPACRSALRIANYPTFHVAHVGFRVSLPVDAVKAAKVEQRDKPASAAKLWKGWAAGAPAPAIAPFDADQAKTHQEAWAKYLNVPVEYSNSIGMKFCLIPPGEFLMGSTPAEIEASLKNSDPREPKSEEARIKSEGPQHKVILTQPFYLGAHEVRQQDYESVTGVNPSIFSTNGPQPAYRPNFDTSKMPVDNVNWYDCTDFCSKLSTKENLKSHYSRISANVTPVDGNGYRLPTEAEWECACRAGTTTRVWYASDEDASQTAWLENPAGGRPYPVGQLKPNPFGLYDIYGNSCEFVEDGWSVDGYAQFASQPAIDPRIPFVGAPNRILRGVIWPPTAATVSSTRRSSEPASNRRHYCGMRVALSIEAVKLALANSVKAEAEPERNPNRASNWKGWPKDAPAPAIAPFDAEQAKQHQENWAKHLKVPVEYTNSIGMKFRLIPPGEFTMGSTAEEIEATLKIILPNDWLWTQCARSESPQHTVVLTKPMYVGVHEVTQAQYERVMGKNLSHFALTGAGKDVVAALDTSSHPVEMASWIDAAEFSAKLSQQENVTPFYLRDGEQVTLQKGTGYRLPTEAEWEFACRAGTTTKYWMGDNDADLIRAGWFIANSGNRTHAVGELQSNPFGLYDVYGNVFEWVQDWWAPQYYAQFHKEPSFDPSGTTSASSMRVLRGGAWFFLPAICRSSMRMAQTPSYHAQRVGFRVALTVEAVRSTLK